MLTEARASATSVAARVEAVLTHYRVPIAEQLTRLIPNESGPLTEVLYEPIRRYALGPGKGLRPAICIATCRALGGGLEGVLPSAAVLELYHNAFLVHDDVEDGSQLRRSEPALHVVYGAPMAVNAGDAMLALALPPLLDNTRLIGLGKALRVLEAIAKMARECAEGQAIELDWIRRGDATIDDTDYLAMVTKKTASYSFIAPVAIGAIVAGAPPSCADRLAQFAASLGVAFQIRDDTLNLRPSPSWGKERFDDLWEGKRTLVLTHALRMAAPREREQARAILGKRRPGHGIESSAHANEAKQPEEIAYLMALIERTHSLEYADEVAMRFVAAAQTALASCEEWLLPSAHLAFLQDLVEYVRARDH